VLSGGFRQEGENCAGSVLRFGPRSNWWPAAGSTAPTGPARWSGLTACAALARSGLSAAGVEPGATLHACCRRPRAQIGWPICYELSDGQAGQQAEAVNVVPAAARQPRSLSAAQPVLGAWLSCAAIGNRPAGLVSSAQHRPSQRDRQSGKVRRRLPAGQARNPPVSSSTYQRPHSLLPLAGKPPAGAG